MAYASRSELVLHGLPSSALGSLSTDQQDAALAAASDKIDSYIGGRYALPLSAWGADITAACCRLAVWDLLNVRGFPPQPTAGDEAVRLRAEETIAWLRDVQRSAAHPRVTPAPSPQAPMARPRVITSSNVSANSPATATNRGW